MSAVSTETEWSPLFAEIVTAVWRLRRRFGDEAISFEDQLRRAQRDLESLWGRLRQAGVEVLDHTGERYEAGKSLKVLAFQTMPEVQEWQVVETLKPTIYYQEEWLQLGEVIVGIPPAQDAAGSESNSSPGEET